MPGGYFAMSRELIEDNVVHFRLPKMVMAYFDNRATGQARKVFRLPFSYNSLIKLGEIII